MTTNWADELLHKMIGAEHDVKDRVDDMAALPEPLSWHLFHENDISAIKDVVKGTCYRVQDMVKDIDAISLKTIKQFCHDEGEGTQYVTDDRLIATLAFGFAYIIAEDYAKGYVSLLVHHQFAWFEKDLLFKESLMHVCAASVPDLIIETRYIPDERNQAIPLVREEHDWNPPE